MANTPAFLAGDHTRRKNVRRVDVNLSGNYATGGEAIDLSNVANPLFIPGPNFGAVPTLDQIEVEGVPGGYTAEVVAGTGATLATAIKLKFYTTAGAELAAAAYPAALSAAASQLRLVVTQSPWAS